MGTQNFSLSHARDETKKHLSWKIRWYFCTQEGPEEFYRLVISGDEPDVVVDLIHKCCLKMFGMETWIEPHSRAYQLYNLKLTLLLACVITSLLCLHTFTGGKSAVGIGLDMLTALCWLIECSLRILTDISCVYLFNCLGILSGSWYT